MREGDVLTLVTWGNCVELAEESLDGMETALSVELIDLRSIAPWDRACVTESVCKTGRLLVLQEDNISASIGKMLVAELCSERRVLEALKSPPTIVSKGDVHIGFNPIYEYAALPDRERVIATGERGASGICLELFSGGGKMQRSNSKAGCACANFRNKNRFNNEFGKSN